MSSTLFHKNNRAEEKYQHTHHTCLPLLIIIIIKNQNDKTLAHLRELKYFYDVIQ